MSVIFAALFARTIVPTAELPPTDVDPCIRFEQRATASDVPRVLTIDDLVELVDIGVSNPHDPESPFGISPDGKSIAFVERRANAHENRYCQRLVVTRSDGSGGAKELDRGGDFIRKDFAFLGFASLMSGGAKVIRPRWSPDGSAIAFLKRVGSTSQVWLVAADGGKGAHRATSMPDDVDDFAWLAGGKTLLVASRPGIRLQAEAIAREAREGFLFDDRFSPDKADRPIPRGQVATEYHVVDLSSGAFRTALKHEIQILRPNIAAATDQNRAGFIKGAAGVAAWREAVHPKRLISPAQPVLALAGGRQIKCTEPFCIGTRELWWSEDGRHLYLRQKTGRAGSQTALLSWKMGEAAPKKVMVTDDLLVGCQLAKEKLICAREGANQPRRLVAIDPQTSREAIIHDPNPMFRNIALGTVTRLQVRNAFGVESWADLVLPPQHRAGAKHPLIVVQYFSDGFLRGGTGDEFPIQLLAAKGFAVLSFARPDLEPKAETEDELMAATHTDWIDRRSVQSSLELSIDLAVATGTVDKDRMGITGFSDGTATTQWALINSPLFKAASIGSCCEDMYAFPLGAGPYFTNWTRKAGRRYLEPGIEEHWKPLSLILNVDRVNTPILVQTGDSEYEIGLDVAEVYRTRGKAFELYVLEDEPHVKYQPAHRRAIYARSTEWFQFWLKGEMNCDPAKSAQYDRWKAMPNVPSADKLQCETTSVLP
jgi:dipeptidyl aminopeptidase/acylaminoacyl peptidase